MSEYTTITGKLITLKELQSELYWFTDPLLVEKVTAAAPKAKAAVAKPEVRGGSGGGGWAVAASGRPNATAAAKKVVGLWYF